MTLISQLLISQLQRPIQKACKSAVKINKEIKNNILAKTELGVHFLTQGYFDTQTGAFQGSNHQHSDQQMTCSIIFNVIKVQQCRLEVQTRKATETQITTLSWSVSLLQKILLSGFRAQHSTKTTFVMITNDLMYCDSLCAGPCLTLVQHSILYHTTVP